MGNTIWGFFGQVTVTHGETFTFEHDDGLTLVIGGVTVIDSPGPTFGVPTTTTGTWTGPSGSFLDELIYAVCCGPPSPVATFGPAVLVTLSVPEPSTWAMMVVGLAGLGYAGMRRASAPRLT
jgi:hypothetical protein